MISSVSKEKFEDYDGFVEKFKPKKTTDDCYTPDSIMECVNDWVAEKYDLDKSRFVRPFWPGGDYQSFDYPEGCAVVDNPPFSIISKICNFYEERKIPFFLFAPALTGIGLARFRAICFVAVGADVMYENGAVVKTSFVTNLAPEYAVVSCPELYGQIKTINNANRKKDKPELPKYDYPVNILTSAMAQNLSIRGIEYSLKHKSCSFIRELEAQKAKGKTIFGGGFILSEKAAAEKAAAEKAAAEKAAAEKAAAEKWELSKKEQEIIQSLI